MRKFFLVSLLSLIGLGSAQTINAQVTREMTPSHGFLSWDELEQHWAITVYENDGEDPMLVFIMSVDGDKATMPTSMVLTNSTNEGCFFVDPNAPEEFGGTIENADITLSYEGTGYLYDNIGGVYYVNAKIKGEMNDAEGNKVIVNEPENFIKFFVSADIVTGIESIQNAENSIQKVIENGVLYIMHNETKYNVQGVEVQ